MQIQRIPLGKQLEQIRMGTPAHPEFNACAIQSWAETPLEIYFGSLKKKLERLAEILGIPPGKAGKMTYRETAAICYGLCRDGKTEMGQEAAELLAAPIIRYNVERRKLCEKGTEDPD